MNMNIEEGCASINEFSFRLKKKSLNVEEQENKSNTKKESEYVRSYKLVINSLQRQLDEKDKIIQELKSSHIKDKPKGIIQSPIKRFTDVSTNIDNSDFNSPIIDKESENKLKGEIKNLHELLLDKDEQINRFQRDLDERSLLLKQFENRVSNFKMSQQNEEHNKKIVSKQISDLQNELNYVRECMKKEEEDYKEKINELLEEISLNKDAKKQANELYKENLDFKQSIDDNTKIMQKIMSELKEAKEINKKYEHEINILENQMNYMTKTNTEQMEIYQNNLAEKYELKVKDILTQNKFLMMQIEEMQEKLNNISYGDSVFESRTKEILEKINKSSDDNVILHNFIEPNYYS